MARVSLNGDAEKPSSEAVKLKPGAPLKHRDVGDAKVVDSCQKEMLTGSGTSPRERNMMQSTKLKGVGDLKNILSSDMEMQNLEFAQLVFGLSLVQNFSLHSLSSPVEW